MGIRTQAKLVVKHTFLEFRYEQPSPRVQGRRTRAWTDTDILEPRRHDGVATHCKSIGSKVPEAAASLAAATAEEAAALAADFAEYGLCKPLADLNIREDSTEVSTEASTPSAAYAEAVEAAAENAEVSTEASTSSATNADVAEAYEAPAVDTAATSELKTFLGLGHLAQAWEEQQTQMIPYSNFTMPMAMEMVDMYTPSASSCYPVAPEDLQYQVLFMQPGGMGAAEQLYPCYPAEPLAPQGMPHNFACGMSPDLVDPMGLCGWGYAGYGAAYTPADFSSGVAEQVFSPQPEPAETIVPVESEPVVEAPATPEPVALDETRTTVMLRNLPNNYTCEMLLELVDSLGFSGHYDLVYLPVDFSTGAGLGYAFVNLISAEEVPAFWARFAGFHNWAAPSDKVCSVTWSHPHQGLAAHVERYRNSPVMHPAVPDGWKPALFERGARVPFPTPTKKLKAPRMKCLEIM